MESPLSDYLEEYGQKEDPGATVHGIQSEPD